MARGWRPLVEGEAKARAAAAVDLIADTLAAAPPDDDGSLLGGSAGRAVFHAYLARARGGDAEQEAIAEALLDHATGWAASSSELGLFSGITGVGWALSHLPGRCLPPDAGDPAEEIDLALDDALAGAVDAPEIDLLRGLTGIGLYALERMPRPGAARVLGRVVALLEQHAERDDDGARWWQIGHDGERAVNLGTAHGSPSIAAVLAGAAAVGVEPERARRLAERAVVGWLSHRDFAASGGIPLRFVPGKPAEPSRPSWCYGAPGVAAALMTTAASLGRDDWRRDALALACHAAACPPDTVPVQDSCLCHGAGALAHLYARLFQLTGDPALGAAATEWLERTLTIRQPPALGLLEGRAGVGLALVAAISDVDPAWDRLLIASPAAQQYAAV